MRDRASPGPGAPPETLPAGALPALPAPRRGLALTERANLFLSPRAKVLSAEERLDLAGSRSRTMGRDEGSPPRRGHRRARGARGGEPAGWARWAAAAAAGALLAVGGARAQVRRRAARRQGYLWAKTRPCSGRGDRGHDLHHGRRHAQALRSEEHRRQHFELRRVFSKVVARSRFLTEKIASQWNN